MLTDAITLCLGRDGKPRTVSGLGAPWGAVTPRFEKEEKVQKGLTLKALRHTVATIVLGQKTIEMARHYSSRADRSRKMENVVKDFENTLNKRRTKIV